LLTFFFFYPFYIFCCLFIIWSFIFSSLSFHLIFLVVSFFYLFFLHVRLYILFLFSQFSLFPYSCLLSSFSTLFLFFVVSL
jgi:hypothetical protein